jgi:uncharacterized protein (DUF3084 family)
MLRMRSYLTRTQFSFGVGRTQKHQRDDAATATHWMSPPTFSSMATRLRTCRLAAIAVLIATKVRAQTEGAPRPVANHHAHLRSIWRRGSVRRQIADGRTPCGRRPTNVEADERLN